MVQTGLLKDLKEKIYHTFVHSFSEILDIWKSLFR